MARRFRIRWNNPLGLGPRFRLRTRRWSARRILRFALMTLGCVLVGTVFLFAWYARDLPTPGKIQKRHPVEATQILDRTGKPLYAVFGEEKRLTIPADQIPEVAKHATIAIEDKDFYKHHGINFRSVARAMLNNVKRFLHIGGRSNLQGASTITQQYVKNALLSPERTIDRKIKELILSIELEAIFSKDEILALYLNEIPYGSNAYGIEAAAETFFGKPAQDLTLAEAATLAALPQRPTYLSPYGNHVDQLVTRKNLVLTRMTNLDFISLEAAAAAKETKVTFVPRREQILAPHFVFYVRDLLVEKYGERLVLEGGLRVTTTLDPDAQRAAEEAITTAADKYLAKYQADNAALAAVNPKTGHILAMVGSIDYFNTEKQGNFNVSTAARQPGSSFKPIVYATAFKEQWSPASIRWDVPTDFGNYQPENFDGGFRGPVTIRSALANSLNIPAVKTLALVGVPAAVKTAQDLGITTLTDPDRYGLSLVLGGAEVKPLELAAAYGVFGAGGTYHPTTSILKVEDSKGKVLETWKDQTRQALPPEVAYQITSILSDNEARAPVFGTRSPLFFGDRPVAAKTGTTQEYRDAWTAGYTPSVAAAVWVGNNDNSPMNKSGGVRAAGPIFHDFLTAYLKDKPMEQFPRPEQLTETTVDTISGKLPTDHSPQTTTDLFASWQLPTEKDDVHLAVKVNKTSGKLANEFTPPDLIETRVYNRIHSERPSDPRWEDPVRSWARDHDFEILDPPSEKDDATAENLPKLTIAAPTKDAVLTGPFDIIALPTSTVGIRRVEFYIDTISIGSRTSGPWSVTYDAQRLASGNHELLVELTDTYGAKTRASQLLLVARDQTPPGAITNFSGQALGGGQIRLTWTNPADVDVAKIRLYRSTVSGQVGTLIEEIASTASTTGTTTIIGQAAGTTYYFTVRPVDTAGNETTPGNQLAVLAL